MDQLSARNLVKTNCWVILILLFTRKMYIGIGLYKGVNKYSSHITVNLKKISIQALARELVSSKKTVNRLHENRAQMNSISMHLGESVGTDIFFFFLDTPERPFLV